MRQFECVITTITRTIGDDIRFPDDDTVISVAITGTREALEPLLVAALAAESTGTRAWDRYTTVTLGTIREVEVIAETPVDRVTLRDGDAYTAFMNREHEAAIVFEAERETRAQRAAIQAEARERMLLRALTQKFGSPT